MTKYKLPPYYISFTSKDAKVIGCYSLDKHDIPMVNFKPHGNVYFPGTISQYALAYHEFYVKNGEEKDLNYFLKLADWFVNNLEDTPHGLKGWLHHFDKKEVNLKSPWISCLSQGRGLSVLSRAYDITQEKIYLQTAQLAKDILFLPIEKGGVQSFDEYGRLYLEEYPNNNPAHVLNGFIFGIFGIYDYWTITGEPSAKVLFDNTIETLKNTLHLYDTGFWTKYDQKSNTLVNNFYHNFLHIKPLRALYNLSNERVFIEYSIKWDKYNYSKIAKTKLYIYGYILKIQRLIKNHLLIKGFIT